MAKRKAKRKTARKPARKATKRKTKSRSRKPVDLIISKSRTKAAASINVSGDFYTALDGHVRAIISEAEKRAEENGRKTLRPYDL